VARHGLDFGFPKVVMDAARLCGHSYFSTVRASLRLGYSTSPWIPDEIRKMKPHFVNFDALADRHMEYASNPWVSEGKGLAGVAATKQVQILFLANLLNRHQHLPRAEFAYQDHPLLSQPLIELCLRIPTYLLVRGGQRRAMARSAFRDLVPHEILKREDKGDTSERARIVIRQNQVFFRDLLQNGKLVRSGIVSWAALKRILADGQSFREEEYWPLRACITAEIWAQSGSTRGYG
jgi:asparagine synthase (glutamine-hydrolysing)